MVESLLFGHRRGAFTDARETAVGFIEASREGTLYLDELESLPVEGQVKLLRVLESQEIYRVGDTDPRPVDLRVVASVHERLPALVAAGVLRRDLFGRPAGPVTPLPPLRDRGGDAWMLAAYFSPQHRRNLRT